MMRTLVTIAVLSAPLGAWSVARGQGATRIWDSRVVNGRRRPIGGWSGRVSRAEWQALAIEATGDRLQVLWR